MPFRQFIKSKVGDEIYTRLEQEAEKEVALAMAMPLVDEYGDQGFYRQRNILGDLLLESKIFEDAELKISPVDVVNILFRCKILFAVPNDSEYSQRIGGGSYPDQFDFRARWSEREENIETVIDRYFDRLESGLEQKILISKISCFHSSPDQQVFFDDFFSELNLPFEAFLDETRLLQKHQEMEPGLREYNLAEATDFLSAPSIGFRTFGSEFYSRIQATAYLRTLLNLLRIAGFISDHQHRFGWRDVQFMAPTAPIIRGAAPFRTLEVGGYFCWDEDKKASWEKIPDGCLFLSFGYRGLSSILLDQRSFSAIKKFIIENRVIFDELKNPWTPKVLNDLFPTIDLLSSVTQIPDIGAKILLLYCCLEHLFVPKGETTGNKKYIEGGLNALNPNLIKWFKELYDLRCDYAHKGFVLNNDKVDKIITESIKNITALLVAKIKATQTN